MAIDNDVIISEDTMTKSIGDMFFKWAILEARAFLYMVAEVTSANQRRLYISLPKSFIFHTRVELLPNYRLDSRACRFTIQ